MSKKIRFHAIAISIISVVIVVLYLLIGPKPAPSAADVVLKDTDHFVRIVSATWGKNCDAQIDTAIQQQSTMPADKDSKGEIIVPKPMVKASFNNVFAAVNAACNRKLSCSIVANSATLGVEPMQGCFKKLDVSYRCFDIDRLNAVTIGQGDPLQINCGKKP